MAKGNRTTSKPRGASVAKVTLAAADRPHVAAMDSLNQALEELSSTVRALYLVDTHINDSEDHEACRTVLSRLLMADLGLLKDAERQAWRVVVAQKGGAL
jgi:hypothetical protein